MANLTTNRDTKILLGDIYSLPVAAATKLYAGQIAGVKLGYLVPASGAGITIPGRVEEDVDNSTGAAGACNACIRRCVVGLDPGTGIAQAAVGTMVYFSDDHTVTTTATSKSPAGILLGLFDGQAWVDLNTAAPGSYPELEE